MFNKRIGLLGYYLLIEALFHFTSTINTTGVLATGKNGLQSLFEQWLEHPDVAAYFWNTLYLTRLTVFEVPANKKVAKDISEIAMKQFCLELSKLLEIIAGIPQVQCSNGFKALSAALLGATQLFDAKVAKKKNRDSSRTRFAYTPLIKGRVHSWIISASQSIGACLAGPDSKFLKVGHARLLGWNRFRRVIKLTDKFFPAMKRKP
jgi:hypothetical protein